MSKKYFNVNGKCTAFVWDEMMCAHYEPDPCEHRYRICVFRKDFSCIHKPLRYQDELADIYFSKDVEASNSVAQCFDGNRLLDSKGNDDE
jgi:hypothetical protein